MNVCWPGVTFPKQRAFANGNNEVIITWGDSQSISDASIEFYTVRTLSNTLHCSMSSLRKIGRSIYSLRMVNY